MVGLLESQTPQCVVTAHQPGKIQIDGVKNTIVGNAAFNNIIFMHTQTFPATAYIIKPFSVIT